MIPVWNIGDAHVLHELFVRDDGDLDTGSGVDGDQHLGVTEYVIDVISYQYSFRCIVITCYCYCYLYRTTRRLENLSLPLPTVILLNNKCSDRSIPPF